MLAMFTQEVADWFLAMLAMFTQEVADWFLTVALQSFQNKIMKKEVKHNMLVDVTDRENLEL